VIAYLLCTSALPFTGTDPKEILPKMRAGQYRPIEQAAADLPPTLARLITRMLSANAADRPQTGHEVVAVLNDVTRSCGIECTAGDMSALLANLFPDEQTDSAPTDYELVRMSQPDIVRIEPPAYDDPESPPLTPDVSVTVSPRSMRASLTPRSIRASSPPSFTPIPATPPRTGRASASMPTAAPRRAPTSSPIVTPRRPTALPSTTSTLLKLFALLATLAVVGYFLLQST